VRFTSEIAGIQELGTTGRGENMEIGTWVERSIQHELSGNVIDLCPVGALNSKPFRFQGRSWEMTQHALVSPHDPVGTNLYGHVLRGRLLRVVPRPNEAINETWIADRDRFSCEGIYSPDRLTTPLMKVDGEWHSVDWETALTATAQGLRDAVRDAGPGSTGFLGAPTATTEELYLLGRLARGLGSSNVDSRLRQRDFRDQEADPLSPGLGMPLADVSRLDAALLAGCHLRHEAPLLAHRLRQAAVRHGARVSLLNAEAYPLHFPVQAEFVAAAPGWLDELLALVKAAAEASGASLPERLAPLASAATPSDAHRAVAAALGGDGRRMVLLGGLAMQHTAYADLRAAAEALAGLTGATLALLPYGGNAAGAALAGALPHRQALGQQDRRAGLHAGAMLERPLGAYLLFGGIEPEFDIAATVATETLRRATFVAAATPYATDAMKSWASVLLPIGTFAETSGTYVNAEGRWQSFAGCVRPLGEARPGWKVLRVLGNLLGLDGFEYDSSEQVLDELRAQPGDAAARPPPTREVRRTSAANVTPVPIYGVDAVVRRSAPLQQTTLATAG
jgi:NADH-quinone oxidoreductase subunit G